MSQQIVKYTVHPLFIKAMATLNLLIADKQREPESENVPTLSYHIAVQKIAIEQTFGLCLN
jgi:hypothetical protein